MWIPSQRTEYINDAGVMTLARRLGFDEQTFASLKKQSGCKQFKSWGKLLGTPITTYDGKYYNVTWVALGNLSLIHI